MIIRLEELNSEVKDKISFDEELTFPSDMLEKSDIIDIEDARAVGNIFFDASNELTIRCNVSGKMILEDSISLDNVEYPFSIDIDENIEENLEKDENSIDILPILWQNIVLEVPLRFTKVNDLSKYNGDGWKLISEEEASSTSNNPFLELKEKYKEEW